MKKTLKVWLGAIAFRTGLYRMFFRRKAIVVLFHRVDDRYPDDPISVTTAKFREYCEFFKRYFTVIPLAELVERLRRGQDIGRHLVITFDDGYLDNAVVAAPLLRTLGLPACFFIATEFIGSDRTPPWDAKAGIRSEWMNWDQVRALHDASFEIGAHTSNHVDLGVVSGPHAQTEITGSGRRLETEIGAPVKLFSYPFGGVDQLTEANRQLVRDAAYDCCVSAYGGTVPPGTDPFHIKRTAISPWHGSPFQFGVEAMLA